ncbi:hypothetical protein [Desulfitobacterium dehalogenans]|uniref:hypothetical protein n=1 Tax=Desulfitobacterium dehalogenans TaxID=36854 RepID=UPI0013053DBA|nr:hypothetical protein [Desulfitobacterium dehalogenans]
MTPELLQQWQADPQRAPGRMVSCPWPDRIDILTTEMHAIDQCTVHGEIIEVTSLEMVQGGAEIKYPFIRIFTIRIKGFHFILHFRF